jgi:hypothetical protein
VKSVMLNGFALQLWLLKDATDAMFETAAPPRVPSLEEAFEDCAAAVCGLE